MFAGKLLKLLRLLYCKLFPEWTERLKNELVLCDTVIDLGCGYNSPIQYCDIPFSVGVEIFDTYLQESKRKCIHNEYIKADVRNIKLEPKSFDAVVALDLLEHLSKDEGYALIREMVTWAKKKVIVKTPNGIVYQDDYDNNPFQEHKSGWSARDLRKLGFKVYGKRGWKILRGYRGAVKFRPTWLWGIISDLTQTVTYFYPEQARQLVAIKQIEN